MTTGLTHAPEQSLKPLECSENKQSLLWDPTEHFSGSEYQPWIFGTKNSKENLNMDYTAMLLLLVLNISGAICAVVQWTELNEAKVR